MAHDESRKFYVILFKACLFNLTFHKGSHSKGQKLKSTACSSKKNKTFHRKVFWATFHGSTNLFEKYVYQFEFLICSTITAITQLKMKS